MACCVRYIRDTADIPLTLETIKDRVMRWWIDASYEVHPDMKSHSGGILSLGKGAMQIKSSNQNLNTQISTESRIVVVKNHMSSILCSIQSLDPQGYRIEDNIIF